MSFYRVGMLGLALFIVQVAETNAQTVPLMGYVAAKNANSKRLEILKKGLADLGYVDGKTSASNTARRCWTWNTMGS